MKLFLTILGVAIGAGLLYAAGLLGLAKLFWWAP
jgi:hypothetical protein